MKGNRVSRGSRIEFDYSGWGVDGAWKREGRSGLGMPCENGCDWPGECKERAREVAKEMRKSKQREKIAKMMTYSHHFCAVA